MHTLGIILEGSDRPMTRTRLFPPLLCAALLAAGASFAAADAKKEAKATASADTVKMVEFFTKSEISDLPPERIPAFLQVDAGTLPAKLVGPYLARKEELLTLKKMADSRNKPPIRRLDMSAPPADQCLPSDNPKMERILMMAGYGRIDEDEARKLSVDTKCTECELVVEFSLRKIADPKQKKPLKKGEEPKFLFFLHEKDPLWNLVGLYRAGRNNPFGTNFFGIGHPSCH